MGGVPTSYLLYFPHPQRSSLSARQPHFSRKELVILSNFAILYIILHNNLVDKLTSYIIALTGLSQLMAVLVQTIFRSRMGIGYRGMTYSRK